MLMQGKKNQWYSDQLLWGNRAAAGLQTESPHRSMKLQAKSADAHKLLQHCDA